MNIRKITANGKGGMQKVDTGDLREDRLSVVCIYCQQFSLFQQQHFSGLNKLVGFHVINVQPRCHRYTGIVDTVPM